MSTLVVRHRVRDYDAWKPVFDEHEAARRRHGAIGHRLYRVDDAGTDLVISMEYPSAEAAQAFVADPSLAEAMERAGVEGEPQIMVVEQLEERSYATADMA